MAVTRVLFVCTGNICRSPTAEGVFRAFVERAGLDDRINVDSAGTHGYHIGEPPDARAIAHARRRGYDLSTLRARRVAAADFERFDLILACDLGHHGLLRRLADTAQHGRIAMFLDYAPELGLREIPDPYYGDPRDFEHVLDIVERASQGLLTALQRKLA
ncbi:MAG: low molecular weight phosphotyrosine protein phosphatase [Alphaproteobacteria bacterium]|nr:low molecular weight phosphotyrosine protein phosphatase [Alphaproteobacteria bacterium]